MILVEYILSGVIFLQSLDVTSITDVFTAKDLTVNGLLIGAIIYLYSRSKTSEEEVKALRKDADDKYEALRKERDDDKEKYVQILINTTKVIDENTRMYARLEKILDK